MGFSRQEDWSGLPLPSPNTMFNAMVNSCKCYINICWSCSKFVFETLWNFIFSWLDLKPLHMEDQLLSFIHKFTHFILLKKRYSIPVFVYLTRSLSMGKFYFLLQTAAVNVSVHVSLPTTANASTVWIPRSVPVKSRACACFARSPSKWLNLVPLQEGGRGGWKTSGLRAAGGAVSAPPPPRRGPADGLPLVGLAQAGQS